MITIPNDPELDRLQAEQTAAFSHKRQAGQDQEYAWQRRQAAAEDLDRAYQDMLAAQEDQDEAWTHLQTLHEDRSQAYRDKHRAYDEQQAAWNDYQRIRSDNGSRIDDARQAAQTAHENMIEAFENASEAYESHDGASASAYAAEGHSYRDERDSYHEECRQLVDEIREARATADTYQAPFQAAKAAANSIESDIEAAKSFHDSKLQEFRAAKARHTQERGQYHAAKAEHAQSLQAFRDASDAAEQAKEAFHARLAEVRQERREQQSDRAWLAEQAGIPYEYQDDVVISIQPDGTVNFYFGGDGTPDGPGHGHYVMDSAGNVTYARDPYQDHGAHNFTDYEEPEPQLSDPEPAFYERLPEPVDPEVQAREELKERLWDQYFNSQYFDDGEAAGLTKGGDRSWETPVHGTDAGGNDVTASFGREGTKYEGQSLISDGHKTSEDFYGPKGQKGHDHAHPSDPKDEGYQDRGKYSG